VAFEIAFLQNNTYGAELTRRDTLAAVLARGATVGSVLGGLVGGGDLTVTYGGSGLNCSVAAGECYIPGSSSTTQGGYYLRNTTTATLTPAAASGSNPRVDLIYAQAQDQSYTGSANLGTIMIATGTPTSGATLSNLNGAPSLPVSSLALAYVLIPQSASTINNTDILNVALTAHASLPTSVPLVRSASATVGIYETTICTSAITPTLPAAPPHGCSNTIIAQSGTQTITANSGQTINHYATTGLSTLTIPAGMQVTLEYDVTTAVWYVTWGGFVPETLLATHQYSPGSIAGYSLSGTLAALDTTNLTLPFTVPPSGNAGVVFDITVEVQVVNTGAAVVLGVLNHSGGAQLGYTNTASVISTNGSSGIALTAHAHFHLTGLTPGALQVDMAGAVTSGQVGNAYALGSTGGTIVLNSSPALMQAFAA
jgi:hypothetical protein